MNHLSPFWKWDVALSPELLECFLKEISDLELHQGATFSGQIENVRNSNVGIISGWHWMAGWNRKVTSPQYVQIASYTEGQFYNWHTDTYLLSDNPITRKLTAICLLNSTEDFDGGQLELENAPEPVQLSKGSIVVFPSIFETQSNASY
jgi:predicted 2-oxoglutarate/Fe(II)-dependent dioxygenase YbiX